MPQEQNATLMSAREELYSQLQSEQDSVAEYEEKLMALVQQKADYETRIQVHDLNYMYDSMQHVHFKITIITIRYLCTVHVYFCSHKNSYQMLTGYGRTSVGRRGAL